MTVLIENAYELETIAREIGAIHLKGYLRYPSETGGWQVGDLDLDEYLARAGGRKSGPDCGADQRRRAGNGDLWHLRVCDE